MLVFVRKASRYSATSEPGDRRTKQPMVQRILSWPQISPEQNDECRNRNRIASRPPRRAHKAPLRFIGLLVPCLLTLLRTGVAGEAMYSGPSFAAAAELQTTPSKTVAIFSAGESLLVAADGQTSELLRLPPLEMVEAVAYSQAGQFIAFSHTRLFEEGSTVTILWSNGQSRDILTTSPGIVDFDISPSGETLVMVVPERAPMRGEESGAVWTYNLYTAQSKLLMRGRIDQAHWGPDGNHVAVRVTKQVRHPILLTGPGDTTSSLVLVHKIGRAH